MMSEYAAMLSLPTTQHAGINGDPTRRSIHDGKVNSESFRRFPNPAVVLRRKPNALVTLQRVRLDCENAQRPIAVITQCDAIAR